MQDEKMDVLGAYDEAELIELSKADANGGSPATVIIAVSISSAICPTTKCTSQC